MSSTRTGTAGRRVRRRAYFPERSRRGTRYRFVIRLPVLERFAQLPRLDSYAADMRRRRNTVPAIHGDERFHASGPGDWGRGDSNRAWQAMRVPDRAAAPSDGGRLLLCDPVHRTDPDARAAFPPDSA